MKKIIPLIISSLIISLFTFVSCSQEAPKPAPYDTLILTNDNYADFNDETKMSKYYGKQVCIKMSSDIKNDTLAKVFYNGQFSNLSKYNEEKMENEYIYAILDFSDTTATFINTYFCGNIQKIILSDKVEYFSDVFNGGLLEEIVVPDNNPNFKSIDGILYDKNVTTIEAYPRANKTEKLVIPETITSLSSKIQQQTSNATKEIVFPSKFENFTANYAFYRLGALEKVVFKTIVEPTTGCFTECSENLKFYVPSGKKQDFIDKWTVWYTATDYSGELSDRVFEN